MSLPPVVAVTPGDGRPLALWLEALGRAGLRMVVIREPTIPIDALRSTVDSARKWMTVVVHARCIETLGLGVHVQEGLRPFGASPNGASRHDGAGIDAAFASGADYAFLSPVWAPASKVHHAAPLGLEAYLRLANGRPVYALGGATPDRFRELRRAGGFGIAVLGDLFGAENPQAAARRMEAYL